MRKIIQCIATCAVVFSAGVQAEDLVVKFVNQTGEEHKGVVLIGWTKQGQKVMDGVRPVPGFGTIPFRLANCSQYSQWQFIASIKYSDNPDNFDTVLMDTGKRPVTKCEYTITGKKG
ncbi:hypothetical protein [Herbaspirillum autotrophicum]|uniref:hypothetical protein n=1 Tax=Herbaspirillum autotrophicum TaxID=180195 RepID=UPI00067DA228|nr:hypothetical protein [Herbaspirillum autotrophicum]